MKNVGFFKYKELLIELVLRDLKIKYRRSILGVLWSILNPLLFMCVTTIIFSSLFKQSIANFPIYFLSGLLIFNLFADSTGAAQFSVISNASLIKKVRIPSMIFPISKVCFCLVNTLLSFVALIVVAITLKFIPPITCVLFFVPFVFVFIFSIGVSLFLSALAVFFRDTIHLYTVFLTMLSYFSAIFYPIEIIPLNYREYMFLNPVYAFIHYLRAILLDGKIPSLEYTALCIFYCVIAICIGGYYFNKAKHKFILYV